MLNHPSAVHWRVVASAPGGLMAEAVHTEYALALAEAKALALEALPAGGALSYRRRVVWGGGVDYGVRDAAGETVATIVLSGPCRSDHPPTVLNAPRRQTLA